MANKHKKQKRLRAVLGAEASREIASLFQISMNHLKQMSLEQINDDLDKTAVASSRPLGCG